MEKLTIHRADVKDCLWKNDVPNKSFTLKFVVK